MRRLAEGVALACVVVAAALMPACGDRAKPPAAASASAGSAPSGPRSPVPGPSSSKLREDPRWRSALGGDEARAAELAAAVGAAELEGALRDEDAVRAVSLRALPFAGDRDASLAALAAALDHARGDEAAVADAIERVLEKRRRDTEVPSRIGARACGTSLARVAKEGGRGGLEAARAEALAKRVVE